MSDMSELTDEWLGVFSDCKARGENLADSIFWRMALECLPMGVDPEDQRVVDALAEIRAAVDQKYGV